MNMTPTDRAQTSPSEQTRKALVHAALRLFGRQGFDGTSTRQIAATAKANIGSIAYHFGGKEGLRMAAADHVVRTIQALATSALGEMGASAVTRLSPDEAREQLTTALERMVSFLVIQPVADDIVQFVLRELASPTPALDRIYSGVFEPTHKRLCAVWAAATGENAESEDTRLTVFTLIGQVIYFRIGREAVLRRMSWPNIGPAEAAKITSVTTRNLDAIVSTRKRSRP